MAEVIKYGVIWDSNFFQYISDVRDDALSLESAIISKIIFTCCKIKAEVVAEDEQETNLRRILNYGHTIGHAVEAVSDFSIIHGKGVAIGMSAAARISVKKGLMTKEDAARIDSIICEYGLPTEIPKEFDRNKIKKYLLTDKKIVAGKISYILPKTIGEVVITDDVNDALIDSVLAGK